MRQWFARAVLVAGCLGLGAQLHAQQDAMSEIYGQGVHRYFAGDYSGAELLLNQVQAAGSEDPRVHYFLGMCKVAHGGGVMAGLADFEAGAQAEARGKNSYQVGLALTRIQGAARREIEKARLAARSQVRQQQLLEQRARTEAAASGRAVPGTASSSALPPANRNVPDPLAEGVRSGTTTVDPVQPMTPDTSNPFGDEPVAPTLPGAPATDTPAAPTESTDPFGTPATDATDPFATPNN